MSDYLTSLARTAIPAAWGALIVWLVSVNLLPAELAAQANEFAVVVTAVAIGVFYALARLLEAQPWFPAWLSRLLLGSAKAPAYASAPAEPRR